MPVTRRCVVYQLSTSRTQTRRQQQCELATPSKATRLPLLTLCRGHLLGTLATTTTVAVPALTCCVAEGAHRAGGVDDGLPRHSKQRG
jgi:hypothetical protein